MAASRIRVLPTAVAEAIAAGEVIERPASAVKELVENALDAGARRVSVEIEGGGIGLIRVVDDGAGMSSEELSLAFRRYATSKLVEIADLARISTFGFRGEALASIAAVAQVTAISRLPATTAASKIEVVDREPGPASPVGAGPGTSIEVRTLFYNTPARRAFLRSPRAEAAACLRVISEAVLGSPEVAFEARVDGRRVLVASGRGGLIEAARSVLGRDLGGGLLAVDRSADRITIVGVLGPPQSARPNRNSIVLMVNGRRVHQRALVAAVEGAYRGLLPVGRHPVAVLDVRCDAAEVDVNVHPTKREVRFQDESRFFEAVQRACWEVIKGAAPTRLVLAQETVPGTQPTDQQWLPAGSNVWRPGLVEAGLLGDQLPGSDAPNLLADADQWRFLGQGHNRYLVVQTRSGIALLDQHAAHEKVLYARVLSSLVDDRAEVLQPAQGLLDPILVEVGSEAVLALDGEELLLRRAGFDLAAFGETTLRCSAVPLGTRLSELRELLLEVLEPGDDGSAESDRRRHRIAASVACHSAVRFGDPMSAEEVALLLRDLSRTSGGITCPHGRPAVLTLSEGQLLAAFGRR